MISKPFSCSCLVTSSLAGQNCILVCSQCISPSSFTRNNVSGRQRFLKSERFCVARLILGVFTGSVFDMFRLPSLSDPLLPRSRNKARLYSFVNKNKHTASYGVDITVTSVLN